MKLRILSLFFLAPLLWAQADLILSAPIEKEKIAIPDFALKEGSGILNEAWRTVNDVLRNDLEASGFLDLISQEHMALIPTPHIGVNFDDWASIDAKLLVVGSVSLNEGVMVVEARLHSVDTKQLILAKAYRGRAELARKISHTIADDIMTYLRNVQFANSRIVFVQENRRDSKVGHFLQSELYIMDYDGHNPFPITQGGISMSPTAIDRDGKIALAYCVFENPNTFNASYGVYLKPTLQDQPYKLYGDRTRRAAAPNLSPDGKKIAFSLAEEGNVDIYVMNLDGTDLVRLTRNPAVDTNPSWAPGGRSLLFTSDRTGSPQIYAIDSDGLNIRRITYENPYNDAAVWNPQYDLIAYVSRFDNDFDIFIMDLRTSKNLRVTQYQGANEEPSWSPDGDRLCFTSNRTGSWQIYTVLRNGDHLRQVTRSGNNRNPVWVH